MNSNILSGVFCLALSTLYAIFALQIPDAPIGNPDEPRFFPLVLSAAGVIFSIVLLVKEKVRSTGEKLTFVFNKVSLTVITVTVAGVAYVLMFETLGYIVSTTIFLFAIMFVMNDGKKHMVTNIVTPIVFSIVVYIIFSNFLNIPLPRFELLEI